MLSSEQFARVAKALADPRRFQILERIAAEGDIACQRLVDEALVAQPTVSHHLKELVAAGLIEPRRVGQFAHYRFRSDVMREYLMTLETRLHLHAMHSMHLGE